jgi:hypothetical protein
VWRGAAACAAALSLGLASGSSTAAASTPLAAFAVAGACSKASANDAVARFGLNDPDVTDPVFKVLCGTFAGPGSRTMVAALRGPGNAGMIDWVVFRWSGGAWRLLFKHHHAAELSAAGADIRETISVYRAGDPRCCPSGGTKSRLWHWNGARLVARAWGIAPVQSKHATFYWPGGRLSCELTDDPASPNQPGVYCRTVDGKRAVFLELSGKLDLCDGAGAGCVGSVPAGTPTLAYGHRMTVGRFRCVSEQTGVACTVIDSGKGFLMNRSTVTRIGPRRVLARTRATPTTGACSVATALDVAEPFLVWGSNVTKPIAQVLCGPFTGGGSEAMAVAFAAPTCWSPQGWAVYRRVGGGWKLALHVSASRLRQDLARREPVLLVRVHRADVP